MAGPAQLSFIVPAHNEEALLPDTLEAIQRACRTLGYDHEVIVVNDSSSDATGAVAAGHGARVLSVAHRQIAATRNAGAAQARGQYLFFIDADTQIDAEYLSQAVAALQAGAAGGGARFRFSGPLPGYARPLLWIFDALAWGLRLSGGCCLFCRRAAFDAAGGFDPRLFAGEELLFAHRLKRYGRFVLIRARVLTSGRKLRNYRPAELLGMVFRLLRQGPAGLTRREGLELWYERR